MPLWESLAGLRVRVDHYDLERRELALPSGWTRVTTTVAFQGDGATGQGEDVTYTAPDHDHVPADLMLAGTWTLDDLSRRLDELSLWGGSEDDHAGQDYRRWAFESAALDLALQQAGTSFADAVNRAYRPVRFVASTRSEIEPYLELYPDLEFKLDVGEDWDRPLMERLASYDRVRVVDLKAYYRGTTVDLAPDPELYRAVVESLPGVVIEDPWLEDGCREALAGAEDRLSFDAPVHSLADLDDLPIEPRWLNVKPSRFGTVRKLVECIEACEARGIAMYGGGQFELGAGRRQIQRVASVFYADGPNDVAPSEYNEGGARPGLPQSPLPAPDGPGFLSVNLFGAELGPGETREGYASRELELGPSLGATGWGGTIYELAPGERICPYHWHAAEEEWLLVLTGAPTLREPDGEQVLRPWDVVVFRRGPGGAHEVRNDTDETASVLMLSTIATLEMCVYPDSGKVSAWWEAEDGTLTGLRNRPEANIEYYDGER